MSPGRMTFRPESSHSYIDAKRTSMVPAATPTRMAGSAPPPPMLVDSTGFESRPLPPLPKASNGSIKANIPAELHAGIEVAHTEQASQHNNSNSEDGDDTGLFMVNRQSSSECSDCSRGPNRDTLVEIPSDSGCTSLSGNAESSLQSGLSSCYSSSGSLSSSCGSHHGSDVDDVPLSPSKSLNALQQHQQNNQKPSSVGLQTMHSAELGVRRGVQTPTKLTISDKRGSAQSESETIVYSPRSDKSDSAQEAEPGRSTTPDMKQHNVKRPELPALPVMESLGEMTIGMLDSTPAISGESFSSFWNDRGF
ncbi:hypothetical protein GGF43_003292 [Coemansia sp. RSA 2618]|nr:hypothetical protein GGF43_003292 [Coemansia sp. RSA 2618]